MISALSAIRTRLVPALLTAPGVVLITAGLLSYADPTAAGVYPSDPRSSRPSPRPTRPPATSPRRPPRPRAQPRGARRRRGRRPPRRPDPRRKPADERWRRASSSPRSRSTCRSSRATTATRPATSPCTCRRQLGSKPGQPGEGSATYLYAHARTGCSGRSTSWRSGQDAKKMLGMIVQVYTSDNKVYLYEIREYRLHALDLDDRCPRPARSWLQTSEGPRARRARPSSGRVPGLGRGRRPRGRTSQGRSPSSAARSRLRVEPDPVDPPQDDGR